MGASYSRFLCNGNQNMTYMYVWVVCDPRNLGQRDRLSSWSAPRLRAEVGGGGGVRESVITTRDKSKVKTNQSPKSATTDLETQVREVQRPFPPLKWQRSFPARPERRLHQILAAPAGRAARSPS
jgi:hypothetical protein